jgi:hypothetical protein
MLIEISATLTLCCWSNGSPRSSLRIGVAHLRNRKLVGVAAALGWNSETMGGKRLIVMRSILHSAGGFRPQSQDLSVLALGASMTVGAAKADCKTRAS